MPLNNLPTHHCEEVWCITCRNRDKAEYEARCGFLLDVTPPVQLVAGCSQCGGDFAVPTARDGFSHCQDHLALRRATFREIEAAQKEAA